MRQGEHLRAPAGAAAKSARSKRRSPARKAVHLATRVASAMHGRQGSKKAEQRSSRGQPEGSLAIDNAPGDGQLWRRDHNTVARQRLDYESTSPRPDLRGPAFLPTTRRCGVWPPTTPVVAPGNEDLEGGDFSHNGDGGRGHSRRWRAHCHRTKGRSVSETVSHIVQGPRYTPCLSCSVAPCDQLPGVDQESFSLNLHTPPRNY